MMFIILQIDPLLQKLSKEGDSSFGGLLLGALRCPHDGGSLMLDMMCSTLPLSDLKLHNSPSQNHGMLLYMYGMVAWTGSFLSWFVGVK